MNMQVSRGELQYVADGIRNKARLDFRKLEESRKVEALPRKNGKSDSFVHLRCGLSEIEASLRFKENASLLHSLDLVAKEELEKSEDNVPTLECNVTIHFNIEPWFSEFFALFNLSISIEVRIIKNDGGIYSLLFSAIKMLFTDVRAPMFKNMREYSEKRISVPLPYCSTFAINNGTSIMDPTLIEEMCSDGVVHVLREYDDQAVGIFILSALISVADILNFVTSLCQ